MASALSPKKSALVRALLTERDVKSAAEAAGVSYSTARRWLALPEFALALHKAEVAASEDVARALLSESMASVVALAAARDDASTLAVSVRAADLLLRHRLQWCELATLEARVLALEESQA